MSAYFTPMKLHFATHNPGKVREFGEILGGVCELEHIEVEYAEIQSDNPEEVARVSAKQLAERYQKPIVVEDSGLFIDALKGFPGVYSAPIHKQIGLKGILKLMEGNHSRGCEYRSAVGFCVPGREPMSFLGKEKGTLAEKERGAFGFGHDPIFIPEGSDKTYGEMKDAEKKKKFRRMAVMQLISYLYYEGE